MGVSAAQGSAGLKSGVCTSTTRPSNPFEGQMIYETDTDMVAIWNGTAWRQLAAATATSGSVLQVQSTTVTAITANTTSSSFGDITGLTVSITPKSTSSKIMVIVNFFVGGNGSADDTFYNLVRNSTNIAESVGATSNGTMSYRFAYDGAGAGYQSYQIVNLSTNYLDSPSSTSSLTYKMQWRTRVGQIFLNRRADTNVGAVSSITVMEIAG